MFLNVIQRTIHGKSEGSHFSEVYKDVVGAGHEKDVVSTDRVKTEVPLDQRDIVSTDRVKTEVPLDQHQKMPLANKLQNMGEQVNQPFFPQQYQPQGFIQPVSAPPPSFYQPYQPYIRCVFEVFQPWLTNPSPLSTWAGHVTTLWHN